LPRRTKPLIIKIRFWLWFAPWLGMKRGPTTRTILQQTVATGHLISKISRGETI
jgi:hypothetical protein